MVMFSRNVTHNLCDAGWLFYLSPCQIRAEKPHQYMILRRGSLIDGTAGTIILRLHVLSHIC
jgi:hypothetical protein